MPQPRWIAHAEHILDSIAKIDSIQRRGRITEDHILYAAALRYLQTLSEATQRLPDELKRVEPEIPWIEISGFRNILVHNYLGEIDSATVESIIASDLPPLREAIARILKSARTD